mgnify:CR=1 FL=1
MNYAKANSFTFSLFFGSTSFSRFLYCDLPARHLGYDSINELKLKFYLGGILNGVITATPSQITQAANYTFSLSRQDTSTLVPYGAYLEITFPATSYTITNGAVSCTGVEWSCEFELIVIFLVSWVPGYYNLYRLIKCDYNYRWLPHSWRIRLQCRRPPFYHSKCQQSFTHISNCIVHSCDKDFWRSCP